MDKSKKFLESSLLVLALSVFPLPLVAATMQATFTGIVSHFHGDGAQWGLGNGEGLSYTATFFYDSDLATMPAGSNAASVSVHSASLTMNGITFNLGSGGATYHPFPGRETNIWGQYNASNEHVDNTQHSRIVQSMGQRAIFERPDLAPDASGAMSDPANSDLTSYFGHEFYSDQLDAVIYGGSSFFDFAEYDLQTGEVISRVGGFLSPARPLTMQVSAVPLPASMPILLCALGILGLLGRHKHALSS